MAKQADVQQTPAATTNVQEDSSQDGNGMETTESVSLASGSIANKTDSSSCPDPTKASDTAESQPSITSTEEEESMETQKQENIATVQPDQSQEKSSETANDVSKDDAFKETDAQPVNSPGPDSSGISGEPQKNSILSQERGSQSETTKGTERSSSFIEGSNEAGDGPSEPTSKNSPDSADNKIDVPCNDGNVANENCAQSEQNKEVTDTLADIEALCGKIS